MSALAQDRNPAAEAPGRAGKARREIGEQVQQLLERGARDEKSGHHCLRQSEIVRQVRLVIEITFVTQLHPVLAVDDDLRGAPQRAIFARQQLGRCAVKLVGVSRELAGGEAGLRNDILDLR